MAPVNECPARRERANISRASGKYMMNFFMRRFFLVFTTIVGTSLNSSLLRTSGRSSNTRLRSSRRESRFLISFLSVHPGAIRKYRDKSTARMPTNRMALIQSIVCSLLLLPVCEYLGLEMDSRGVGDVEGRRAHPGGAALALYIPLIGQPLLLVDEDVLHDQDIPFHPGDFGYFDDLARPVAQPRHLDHDVQGGAHLFPDRPCGKVNSRHQDHRLETRHGVPRGIRVG